MIYFFTFAISLVFMRWAYSAKTRNAFIWLSFLSILIPTLLAGMRGITVGIDTSNYYVRVWERAERTESLGAFISLYVLERRIWIEPLYMLLAGVIEKVTGDYQIFLFCIHSIIISCIYIGAYRLRHHANPVFILLLFYFLYYNYSLNISREFIAISIVFAAFKDIEDRKYVRYYIFVAIASMFHIVGILGVIPALINYLLFPSQKNIQVSFNRRLLVVVFLVALGFGTLPLLRYVLNVGILSSHYSTYVENSKSIPGSIIILLIAETVLLLFSWKTYRANNKEEGAELLFICSGVFLILYLIAPYISYGKRLAQFFSIINITTLGMITKSFQIKSNKTIIIAAVVLFVFVYWLYFYMYLNGSQTMPYVLWNS